MPAKENKTQQADLMLDMMGNTEKIPPRLVKVISRARKRGEAVNSSTIRRITGNMENITKNSPPPTPPKNIQTEQQKDTASIPDDSPPESPIKNGEENIEIVDSDDENEPTEKMSGDEHEGNVSEEHMEDVKISDDEHVGDEYVNGEHVNGEHMDDEKDVSENEDDVSKIYSDGEHEKDATNIASDIDTELPDVSEAETKTVTKSKVEKKGNKDEESSDDSDSDEEEPVKEDDESSEDDYYEDKAKKVGKKLDPRQERRLYRKKEKLLDKFEKLRLSYAKDQATIPEFNEDSDYYTMKRSYKRIKKRLHRNAAISNNQMYLIFLFIIIEWAFTSYLGMDIKGYAKDQTVKIDQYNKLMIELGEKSYITFGGRLPVEVRIVGIAVFNALIMFMLRKVNITPANIQETFNIKTEKPTTIKPLDEIQPVRENEQKNRMKGPSIRYSDTGERL